MKRFARAALILLALLVAAAIPTLAAAQNAPGIARYLADAPASELVPGADSYGAVRDDVPVVPALKGGETVGYVYLNADFVTTTGYSGKPIHILVGLSPDAKITGAKLVHHSEPIVLIGIPEAKIRAVIRKYTGIDLIAEVENRGDAHELDIVSGATVTIMVIDDSIMRSGIKVARELGLGGLEPEAPSAGPAFAVRDDPQPKASDWMTLAGDGSIRSLRLDVGQVNEAFRQSGDPRAVKRPEKGDPSDTFIDMQLALVSVPEIGVSLLGQAEYANLRKWLEDGEQAILVMGRGKYSFKGSGYVRGGIFDRIQLIQGDNAVRFHDKQHRRLGALAADGSPSFTELDIFKIPANAGFDPAEPFRVQLLVQRAVGAIDKVFTTFDLGYQTPGRFLERVAPPPAAEAPENERVARSELGASDPGELSHLWRRIWEQKRVEVGVVLAMIGVLTGVFFFQMQVVRSERFHFWFRIGFLSFTLFFLGWYANAQLSVVNVLAFISAALSGFSWSAFLMDPLIFILWFSVAASMLFWGRGVFCGWLCPFGALQELTNRIAKLCRIPQIEVPWGLHERLWPIKYVIFLGLFGVSLYSLALAEHYSEVEPFKTAIILKFQRNWPFVLYAAVLLGVGLFVERFYCRYLCPLGAALAIPARLRMFNWLKRYRECGNPCQRCAVECPVKAIHPEGDINPNECIQCLHCQMLYKSDTKCPVCIKKAARRAKMARMSVPDLAPKGETVS